MAAHLRTKIVATVGPSCSSPKTLESLIKNGASVFRLNFSHGTHQEHSRAIKALRTASRKLATPVAIMADLQGPKIRIGRTAGDKPIFLRQNDVIALTTRRGICTSSLITIDYAGILDDIARDSAILLNDGEIRLKVLKVNKLSSSISCLVQDGGVLTSHKGVNFPHVPLKIQSVTLKDRQDLRFIFKQDINLIAQSFVRTPEDLNTLNSMVKKAERNIKIIAKIEKPEALACLSGILDVCDGIMVARGDLGVETSLWEVPILQKRFIGEANRRGKIVIVATQMLESMIKRSTPTRAETTDVANAIIDGTDAVMLSGETAVGSYPVESVQSMRMIAEATEASEYIKKDFVDLSLRAKYPPHAVCEAAEWASRDLGGVAVCVFTHSGDTALYMSKIRNQSPIYAFSPSADVVNMLAIGWNVRSFQIPLEKNALLLVQKAEAILLRHKLLKAKDLIVVVSGTTTVKGATNLLRVKEVGEQ